MDNNQGLLLQLLIGGAVGGSIMLLGIIIKALNNWGNIKIGKKNNEEIQEKEPEIKVNESKIIDNEPEQKNKRNYHLKKKLIILFKKIKSFFTKKTIYVILIFLFIFFLLYWLVYLPKKEKQDYLDWVIEIKANCHKTAINNAIDQWQKINYFEEYNQCHNTGPKLTSWNTYKSTVLPTCKKIPEYYSRETYEYKYKMCLRSKGLD